MSEKKPKELKITIVSYEEFTDIDFSPPSTWFFCNALGEYIFIHTSKRNVAQEWVDEYSGVKGKYRVIPTRDQKTKSRMESGGCSVVATATRARPSSRAPK